MTEAGTHIGSGGPVPLPRSLPSERPAYRGPEARLERLHAYFLEGCTDEIRPVLESVLADARRVHAGYADDEVGDGLASVWYAATAIVELGAALELDEADVRGAGAAIAEACALPLSAARYVLFREVVGNPRLARASAARRDRAAARAPARRSTCSATSRSGRERPAGSSASSRSAATCGRAGVCAPRRRRRSADARGCRCSAARSSAPRRCCASARRTRQSSDASDRSIRTWPTRTSARPRRR